MCIKSAKLELVIAARKIKMSVRRIFRAENPAMFACNRNTRNIFPSDTIFTVKNKNIQK